MWSALNNGDGTFKAPQLAVADLGSTADGACTKHPRFLADMTGDGRADIVGFGDAGMTVATNQGTGTFNAPQLMLKDFGRNSNRDEIVRREVINDHSASPIKHVFVLMLENRSYDHLLGFAGISGVDAATGQPTRADGLTEKAFNCFAGERFYASRGAPDVTVAPGHEFRAMRFATVRAEGQISQRRPLSGSEQHGICRFPWQRRDHALFQSQASAHPDKAGARVCGL